MPRTPEPEGAALRASTRGLALTLLCAVAALGQEARPLDAWSRRPPTRGSRGLPYPVDYPRPGVDGFDEAEVRARSAEDPQALIRSLRAALRDPERNGDVRFEPGAPTWLGAREHARRTLARLARVTGLTPDDAQPRALLARGDSAALEALVLGYPDSPRVEPALRLLAERACEAGDLPGAELLWRDAGLTRSPAARALCDRGRSALALPTQRLELAWAHPFRRAQDAPTAVCLAEHRALVSRERLQAFERDGGRLTWERRLPPGLLSPGPHTVLHASGATLTWLDLQTGRVLGSALAGQGRCEVRALSPRPDGWSALVFRDGFYELLGIDAGGGLTYRTPLWPGDPRAARSRIAEALGRARPQLQVQATGDGQLALAGPALFLSAEGFVARAHPRTGELVWVRDRSFGAPLHPNYAHPVQVATDGRDLWASTALNLLQHLDPRDGASRALPEPAPDLILACRPLITGAVEGERLQVTGPEGRPLARLSLDALVGPGQLCGRLLVLPAVDGVTWVDWVRGGSGRLALPGIYPRSVRVDASGEVLVAGLGGVACLRPVAEDAPAPPAAPELPGEPGAQVAALDAQDWRLRQAAFQALLRAPDVDAALSAGEASSYEGAAHRALLSELRAVRRAWEALAPAASEALKDALAFTPHLAPRELPDLVDAPRLEDLRTAWRALPPSPARDELLARAVVASSELQARLLGALDEHAQRPGLARAAADLWANTLLLDRGEAVRATVIEGASTRGLALLYGVLLERSPQERHALHADPNQWNAASHLAELHFEQLPRAGDAERRALERVLEPEVPGGR